MNFAELIDTQQKSLAALEKRMAARPTQELAERLGEASLDAKTRSIKQRISRLERQREMTIARIDASLASERAALEAIEKLPRPAPSRKPTPAKPGSAKGPPAKTKGRTTQLSRPRAAKAKASKKR